MKKTLAWLLTLFMVLTISSVTVFAAGTDVAKIGESGYATLQAAIDVAVDGDEIVLLGNVSEDNVVIDKDITLDLATKILTAHVTVNGGADVTIKNGTVTVAGNDPAPGASVITVVDGELDDGNGGKTVIPSSLSLNGVTVHGGEAIDSRNYTNAVKYNATGGLTITGCTITGGTATRTDACASIGSNGSTATGLYMPSKSGGTVTISGSTITGGYGKTDAEWTGYVSQLFSPGGCGISLHGTTVVTISDSTVIGGGSNWYNAETAINVSNQFSGTLAVIDSTVTGGTAEGLAGNYGTGGVGVYTHNSTGCEEIVISGSTITGGAGGKSFNGSGIEYRNENVEMTITDSTVAAGNGANASGNGAAISIYDTATSLELDDVKLNGAGNGSNTAIKGSANGITASGPVEIIGGSANIEGGTWSSVTVSDAASINVTAGTIGSLEVEGDVSDMNLGAGATVGSVSVGDKDYFVDSNGNLKEANTVTVCYTSTVDFWGEATSNSKESFVVELYEGDVKIASATLNNIDGIIDGDVYVTWHIPFAGSNDPYWTVEWTAGYPKYDMNPDKVVLVVDGVPSATNVVQYNGPDSINKIVAAVGDSNGNLLGYATAADMQTAVAVDGATTILMLNDVTLADGLALPAGVTLNGNGKTINGTISANGDLTIAGVTKVAGFSAGWYNHTITIGPGASLEITGGGRMTLGYGNIFNITGSIVDAKTVDLNTVVPSLKLPAGISITGGNGAALNVKNAYIEAGLTSSKPGAANGTFDINLTNSVAVFTGKFALDTSTGGMTPVFNTSLKDSVLNVAGNLVFGNTGCNTTIDNSVVNANSSFRNDGSLNLINGSVLNVAAMIQAGENGGNSGTIVVDNSKLNIACSSEGHAIDGQGTGVLEVINGGEASIDYITKTDIEIDIESKLTSKKLMDSCSVTVDAEGFNGGAVQVLDLETPLAAAVNVNVINSRIAALDAQGKLIVDENAVNALGGSGTEADPYTIGSVDDLTLFAELVNSGNDFAGKTVQLTADIDMSDVDNWLPIGLNNHNQKDYAHKSFNGTFDGNNKTISNLTLVDVFFNDGYAGDGHYSTGLFGFASGATIKDLTLANVSGHLDWWSGCVVGKGGHPLTLTNVHVTGADMTGYGTYIGGLVGHCYYANMTDCSFSGTINVPGSAQVGGLLGSGNPNADGCTVNATIVAGVAVGGVVGNAQESTVVEDTKVNVSMSVASGAGGIIGYGNSVSNVSGNYIEGILQANGELADFSIAGVVGHANNGTLGINNNYINAYVKDANGNLVDRPVVGVYNVAVTETTDVSMFDENSWNREIYDFEDLPIYENAPGADSASGNVFVDRNNNLVMLESDLAYIDAENADDVTIMEFSDVTKDEVTQALLVNNNVARITDANGTVTYYETLEEALKAVTANATVELLHDITITSDWDNRNTGAKITVPVTINGNGHTLKFTGKISDGANYVSVFRFEDVASVKDLTIDLSKATSGWEPRLRAISAKTDITIDNCTFIGNADYNNTNAVIIGEGAGAAMGDVVITITDSTFTNWRNGISDNQNGQDAKSATVTGNTFNNANARIAAKNSVVFNNNTMNNGGVTIASFTTPASLAVTAKENTLATGDAIVNEIKNANTIDVQSGFTGAVASVNGTIYGSLEAAFAAAQNGDTIVLIADVDAAVTYGVSKTLTLDLNGYTIESDATATLTATAGKLTIVDNSTAQTGAIVSDGNKAIHSSAYVAIQSGKFVGTITTENGQADDSQVCITGGNFSVEPNAKLVKHTYIVVPAEYGTYNVIPDEYEVIIIANGGEVTGAGFYKFGETVYLFAGNYPGYQFAGWMSDDVELTDRGNTLISFAMPDHAVTVTAYWATSGVSTPVVPVVTGTLHFETNGGTAIDSLTGVSGRRVDLTQYVPALEGYTFAGWYSDAALTKPVTEITLRGTKTVYAGWIKNVTPDVPVVTMPFTDVAADAYYYNAVLWAVNTGITNGITDTTFAPDMVCTRAQVVTFLWRAAGCPVATYNDMPFADVSRDMYYYDAVLWAVEMGITNGISDTEFAPDAECSRAQIVTFLWRALGAPDAAADAGFVDVDADAYYATAVEWAVDNGITNGMGDNTFGADADCTRGQTVTFLFRFFCK